MPWLGGGFHLWIMPDLGYLSWLHVQTSHHFAVPEKGESSSIIDMLLLTGSIISLGESHLYVVLTKLFTMVPLPASSYPPHHQHHIHTVLGTWFNPRLTSSTLYDRCRDWFNNHCSRTNHSPFRRFLQMGPGRDKTSHSYGSKAQKCRLGTTDSPLPQHLERGLRKKLTQRGEEKTEKDRKNTNIVVWVSGFQLWLKQGPPLDCPATWA